MTISQINYSIEKDLNTIIQMINGIASKKSMDDIQKNNLINEASTLLRKGYDLESVRRYMQSKLSLVS